MYGKLRSQKGYARHPGSLYRIYRSLGFTSKAPSTKKIVIEHKLIRPRTTWHNGKVERSHRNDQERFYNFLSFYSFMDLKKQMYRYMRRSNNITMAVLGWMSPVEKRDQLEGY